ncbi:hypothetical protein NQZ68_029423 [Dissostichus eleginoides]|nr:hypothetical protein NQZ68_029423 [Dissostichus eleginoides]
MLHSFQLLDPNGNIPGALWRRGKCRVYLKREEATLNPIELCDELLTLWLVHPEEESTSPPPRPCAHGSSSEKELLSAGQNLQLTVRINPRSHPQLISLRITADPKV